MFSMKRSISLALCCALVLSLSLAGCKKKSSGTETVKASDLKPYNIVWYTNEKQEKGSERVDAKVSEYLKNKINATITINNLAGDYATKIPVIISSGEQFDVCFTANWVNDFRQNAAKGTFVNLTKTGLLDKYGKDLKKAIEPTLLTGSSINGDLYSVPINKEAAYAWAFTFNKTYVDKYNLDITTVKKFADIEPLLKTIHEKEPDVVPLFIDKGCGLYSSLPYDEVIGSKNPGDISLASNASKIIDQYETQEFKDYFATMRKFYLAGYIPKDAATASADPNISKTGKYFAGQISWTPYCVGTADAYGVTKVAQLIQTPVISGTAGSGSMLAISSTSANKERAMMFLNLLWSDKALVNLLDYGVEGTDYVKVDDKTIDYPTGVTAATSEYTSVQGWRVGNQLLSYVRKGTPADKWDKYADFNKSATKSPALGFSFDNTNVKTQIAAMQNTINQYLPSLSVGAVDPDVYLPQMVDKLKANGMNDVLKEAQTQFDKWKSTKK